MTIFKQSLDRKESQIKQSLELPNMLTNKQMAKMGEMNHSLQEEREQHNVLTTTGLEEFHVNEFEEKVTEKYVTKERSRDANASDRTIRERAEKKASKAVKLRKKLQELCELGRSFDEVVNSNFTIYRLKSFNKKKKHGLSDADAKKMETLKKQAPKAYERLLKLEHALTLLEGHQEQYGELYEFAQREKQQAQNEWNYIENMANMVNYQPAIDKKAERAQLAQRRKPAETSGKYAKDKETELDEAYKKDLQENLKPVKVNLNADTEATENKMIHEAQEQMDYVLTKQMEKIKSVDPDATPEKVKALVCEYLKKLKDSAVLRFRIGSGVAESIMNTRYHSSYKNFENYKSLIAKQFSTNTKLKTFEAISFGILGANSAKEFSGYGSTDSCAQYGKVSVKVNKEKMRGRATYTCGNSLGSYTSPKFLYPFSFYDIKKARDVFGEPELANCGANLADMYFRAKQLKENDWKDIKSAEQEALQVISDRAQQKYFEVQYHGQLGAAEIEEMTVILSRCESDPHDWDFSKKEDLEAVKNNTDVKKVYDAVNIVNANPTEYGRTAEDGDIKVTVWDCHGNTISYDDLKFIMEK